MSVQHTSQKTTALHITRNQNLRNQK